MNKAEIEHKAPIGLRTVALFELVKGFAWLFGGGFCLTLLHTNVQTRMEHLLHFLHVDPAWGFAKLCIEGAAQATDKRLVAIAVFAALSAIVRFAEGYGLWHERHWAEWFAVLSAGLFLPVEVYHLRPHHFTYFKLLVFVINIVVVVYLARLLAAEHQRRKAAQVRRNKSDQSQLTILRQTPETAGRADKA
ncbi:MAG TPA: DUF2127 domain-containing protein [Verrucomicrobiae bacterium]|nr:DUF2127 domain-containing protein [Verrucomicrobiae bacterium]